MAERMCFRWPVRRFWPIAPDRVDSIFGNVDKFVTTAHARVVKVSSFANAVAPRIIPERVHFGLLTK